MASPSLVSVDLTIQPDLQPLYPTPHQLSHQLSPNVGLSPGQKAELVAHCLNRACVFGDLNLLSYLLSDPQAQPYIDLGKHDEDGLGLVNATMLGFGSEVERDMEREECVRLLVAEGADVNLTDDSGWTALHYAALLAPPTLVTFLVTHGCSPFAITRRKSTPLDIVNAHTVLPGREDAALLLEETMRAQGWEGGRMEERRRLQEKKLQRMEKRRQLQESIGKILGLDAQWWGDLEENISSDTLEDEAEEDFGEGDVFTPSPDYTSMIVFSPDTLPDIFQTLITDFKPTIRNSEPANALYMLSRFACLNCDDNWLEDLIIGATDTIEEAFFNRGDDLSVLVFWLYNLTVWLHLMRCDEALKVTCEELGCYTLIEEIINSVFVFIIRFAERRIDQLLDACLLEHSPLSNEFDSIQYESEWSFLRSFGSTKLKKPPPISSSKTPGSRNRSGSVTPVLQTPSLPPSPPMPAPTKFASLKQTFSRSRPQSGTQIQSLFNGAPPPPSPQDVTSFMTALQTLLTLSNINPALTTQLWSQVMYWAACEIFNRILTRKKYLCRSRAVQINMNISVLEEWIGSMGLPRGIGAHFAPVRDLLNWLQCLSSITEFPNLIATIQTMKHMNPLQMRRAVRDYKYEVNEGRMTEECTQYLAQLQKDWERHRVRMGVENLRKEIGEREREREENESPSLNGSTGSSDSMPPSPTTEAAQRNIDNLFDRTIEKSAWEPRSAPEPLGELLDSRYMLPLLLPSDPRMLGAIPLKQPSLDANKRHGGVSGASTGARASDGTRGAMEWRLQSRRIRDVDIHTLQWIDGTSSASRWYRPLELEPEADDEEDNQDNPPPYSSSDPNPSAEVLSIETHITPLAPIRSARNRRVASSGTLIESDANGDAFSP